VRAGIGADGESQSGFMGDTMKAKTEEIIRRITEQKGVSAEEMLSVLIDDLLLIHGFSAGFMFASKSSVVS
jgi:hypothetical protein